MTSMIFYFWINHVFNNIPGVPFIYKSFFLANFLCIIAVFMFNIFTKVSIHTAGAGSVVGVLGVLLLMGTPNMLVPFCIALFIAALVGIARLLLSAHSKAQIFLGYALGILCQLCAFWYLK
jgi:membrane-associated phospholipid phosphatase